MDTPLSATILVGVFAIGGSAGKEKANICRFHPESEAKPTRTPAAKKYDARFLILLGAFPIRAAV